MKLKKCDRCELKEKTLKVMKNHAEIEHEGKTTVNLTDTTSTKYAVKLTGLMRFNLYNFLY